MVYSMEVWKYTGYTFGNTGFGEADSDLLVCQDLQQKLWNLALQFKDKRVENTTDEFSLNNSIQQMAESLKIHKQFQGQDGVSQVFYHIAAGYQAMMLITYNLLADKPGIMYPENEGKSRSLLEHCQLHYPKMR